MPLTAQQSNFVSRLQSFAALTLDLRRSLQQEIAFYNAEQLGSSITDEGLSDVPAFSHLTLIEIQGCITAMSAVVSVLGDDVSGQSVNLLKMRG